MYESLVTEGLLPDTLTPITPICVQETKVKIPWGRLYSCIEQVKSVDLIEDEISLGRSELSTIVINRKNFPENIILIVSKTHLKISRDLEKGLVYIKDESKNGTFINKHLIGKGNRNLLQHDDIISLGYHGSQKLFIYKCLQNKNNSDYLPNELRKKYTISKFLGKGACGEVHLIYDKKTVKPFAIKKITKGIYSTGNVHHLDHPLKIKNEIRILKSLSHPCIIGMKEIIEAERDVFIILEYMAGGELTERILSIEEMTEQNIKFLFYQICLGVKYLHQEGITHRDLKPENVLLATDAKETLVKITDFGLSKIVTDNTLLQTICGTPTYVAPEVLDGRYTEYSMEVDIWSLGVILYYMLGKELPFRAPDRHSLNKLILSGQYKMNPASWLGVSYSARDLVTKMLVVNPLNRLTINGVLKHPWIAKDISMQFRVMQLIKGYNEFDDAFPLGAEEEEEPQVKRSRSEFSTPV